MRLMLTECGILPHHTVLVGLSGGVDSVVLTHLLVAAQREGRIGRVMAAHLHHGIRGADADADASFCAELCRKWDVPFVLGHANVPQEALRLGLSVETAAREARYAFLRKQAAELGADCIAVAHHLDDQAETVLLHLIRGSGLTGLAGMRPRTGEIARPLLAVRRAEIEAYAANNGLAFCTDATNASDEMTRNRIRNELLPLLASFNPRVSERLAVTAELIAADADFLDSLAADALQQAEADAGGYDRSALSTLEPSIRTRALKRLLTQAQPDGVEQRDVQRLDELLAAQTGTEIELRGGRRAWVDSRALHIGAPHCGQTFETPFLAPGKTATPVGTFHAIAAGERRGLCRTDSAWEASVDWALLPEDAVVRTRREGDRFYPLGSPGMRKLSDVMTDRKIPRRERDVPLLCSGNEVLWMPGYTIAERMKITPQSERILHIFFEEDTGNDRGKTHGTGHSGNPFG